LRNNWRIYRLPGSREIWHLDSGPETQVFNVRGYTCLMPSRSIDIGGMNVPRAWIQIRGCDCSLHIINDIAIFAPLEKKLEKKCVCTTQEQPCVGTKV